MQILLALAILHDNDPKVELRKRSLKEQKVFSTPNQFRVLVQKHSNLFFFVNRACLELYYSIESLLYTNLHLTLNDKTLN